MQIFKNIDHANYKQTYPRRVEPSYFQSQWRRSRLISGFLLEHTHTRREGGYTQVERAKKWQRKVKSDVPYLSRKWTTWRDTSGSYYVLMSGRRRGCFAADYRFLYIPFPASGPAPIRGVRLRKQIPEKNHAVSSRRRHGVVSKCTPCTGVTRDENWRIYSYNRTKGVPNL